MKKKLTQNFLYILVAVFTVVILPATSAKQDHSLEKSLLWEISGNGLERPSHLFGTYHLLKDSHLETLPHVLKAFEASEGVVVEIVMDTTALVKSMDKMYMPDNSLENLFPESDYEKLAEKFQSATGQSLSMLNQFKPNVALLQVLEAATSQAVDDLIAGKGRILDLFFAEAGKEQGKVVRPLETIDDQMDMLMNGSGLLEQAEGLEWALGHLEEMQAMQLALAKRYIAQDLDGLARLSEEFPDARSVGMPVEDLLYKRNDNWMRQLPEMMSSGSQFIAVGALHLVGERGLVQLLRAQGYTLTPVLD